MLDSAATIVAEYDDLEKQLADEEAEPVVVYFPAFDAPDGSGAVIVHAGMEVDVEPSADYGFTVTDLPAVERAATLVHCGSMESVGASWQNLGRWIDGNGHRSHGFAREVAIEYTDDPDGWVTELQEPI